MDNTRHSRRTKRDKNAPTFEFTYVREMTPSCNLARFLRESGFELTDANSLDDSCYYRHGNLVIAVFGYENLSGYSGIVLAERAECFDKWGRAPLKLRIPESRRAASRLASLLSWLATESGLEASDGYDYSQFVDET